MADQIKYSNLVQRNEEELGRLNLKPFGSDNKGGIDQVREDMKSKYGWLSPYEYYYGSQDSGQTKVDRTSLMPVFTPQADVEKADKDNIPNWFWVDSFCNWCYIKVSAYLPTRPLSTSTTILGDILHGIVGFDMITGNLLGAIIVETLIQMAEGNMDEWYSAIPTGIVTDWVAASDFTISAPFEYTTRFINEVNERVFTITDRITGGIPRTVSRVLGSLMEASRFLAEKAHLATMSGMISTLIRIFFEQKTADTEAENLIEMQLNGGSTKYNLSRNCLSTYMWNGFTRSWMPIKWMIKIYDSYMKRGNRKLFQDLFGETARAIVENSELYLKTIVPEEFIDNEELLRLDTTNNIRGLITDFRNAVAKWRNDYIDADLYASIENVIERSWNSTNELTRSVFMQVFTFDPACLDVFTTRSPLNKLQTIATAAWGREHIEGFPNAHWLENWGMWVPLPNDKAKIKIYSDNTFQLINRPYSNFSYDHIVSRGNKHTNIGHPCFMRGNDDVLWMCYWLRWSSDYVYISKSSSKLFGIFELSSSTTSHGSPDMSDKDIENWNAILNSMFQKHDDYGFEDWMINCNYGLSYSKFTIDEESPTAVSSYEESELNPLRAPMVNSIDRINKNQLVMRLSDSTVVNREDKNGMSHVAKRWV